MREISFSVLKRMACSSIRNLAEAGPILIIEDQRRLAQAKLAVLLSHEEWLKFDRLRAWYAERLKELIEEGGPVTMKSPES